MDPTLVSLEARVVALESARRRERRLFALLSIVALALVASGQAPAARPRVVEAEAFVLTDAQGKERAQLALAKDGSVQLFMKHQDGVSDVGLFLGGDGAAGLRLRGARRSGALELTPDGGASLRIQEKYAKSSVELGLDGAGRPRLLLTEPDGKLSFKAP